MSVSFQTKLAKLATLSVHSGVGLLPGQELIVSADLSCTPFVRLLQEEGYKAGAKHVFVHYSDEQGTLIRYRHGSSEAIEYAPGWYQDAVADVLARGGA